MTEDEVRVPWNHYEIVRDHPEWVAAVPAEIRWYMKRFGIMDEREVLKLRPIIAQWWV